MGITCYDYTEKEYMRMTVHQDSTWLIRIMQFENFFKIGVIFPRKVLEQYLNRKCFPTLMER